MERDDMLNREKGNKRLFRLHELDDYEVADDDPDVRGWNVLAQDGQKIGEVDDLIVDPNAMKVRYLDIKATDELSVGDGDRHLLIPIGAAQLDDNNDEVHLSGIDRGTLEHYPVYKGDPITLDYEHSLRETLHGLDGSRPDFVDKKGIDFYDTDNLYNEDTFYGPRRPGPDA